MRPSSTQSTIHTNSLVLHCRDCLLCVSLVSLLSCFSLCIVHEYEVTLLKFLAQTSRCAGSHACFRQVKYHNVCVSACRLSLYALSTPCHVFLIVLTFLRIRIRAWRLSSTAHHEIDKARTHAHALPATRATYWIFKTFPFNFPLMDFVLVQRGLQVLWYDRKPRSYIKCVSYFSGPLTPTMLERSSIRRRNAVQKHAAQLLSLRTRPTRTAQNSSEQHKTAVTGTVTALSNDSIGNPP